MTPVWRRDGDDLLLAIRLTPGARREGIGSAWTDADGHRWLSASVRAVPEKGRATIALFALLADRTGCPRSIFSLESGDSNRLKRIRISGGGGAAALDRIIALIEPLTHDTQTMDIEAGPAS